jgi:4-hydroxy-3-methylbut-2-enyl diphosphate reductase
MIVEKAPEVGFCFGVKRAIEIVERIARERGGVETLGALLHNQQVLHRLEELNVRVVNNPDSIRGDIVVISAHGITPQTELELKSRHINIIDTTCPFVRRAHVVARRLTEAGFSIVVFGDAEHAEVKGVIGSAGNRGIATLDATTITLNPLPRRLGILSQTTQIPARFTRFVKQLLDIAFTTDTEFRVIDTICHDIRRRQADAITLAHRVNLMLVIGGHNSANTNRLAELCATVTETHLVETSADINLTWLSGKDRVGITSGASTSEETMIEAMKLLNMVA